MENEKKSDSSQSVLNVVLVIICGAIMGLFVYEYINKNDQIAEYKTEDRKLREKASKEQLAKANKLITLYKQASFNNVPEGLVSDEDNEQIKIDIAKNVSSNLSPIMAKMDKSQDVTNEKLDKIMNELIALLEKETQKGAKIRKQMRSAIEKERKIEAKLQKNLTETQKVVADLNGMVGELKVLYINAHEDDSTFGDLIRCVSAPPKFLKNTLTLDWFVATDRNKAKASINAKQNKIMDRYEAIGDPAVLRSIKASQIINRKKAENAARKIRIFRRQRRVVEPELIRNK